MAIDKKRTSVWMKTVLIFVAVAFVASIVLPAFIGWGDPSPQDSGASETGLVLEQIAASHAPAIAAGTAQLDASPEDYDVLANLGNTYYDWGFQIVNALGQGSGYDLPMWVSATVYYERALAVQPGDPNVQVDMAIAYFYAGDTARAIEVAEAVFEESPEFAPAYYNASIFYRTAGRIDEAVTVLERYLELEPEGSSADAARQMLSELEGAAPVPVPDGSGDGSVEETAQP